MSKKNQAPKSNASIYGVLLIGALAVGAFSMYVAQPSVGKVPTEQRRESRLPEHGGESLGKPAGQKGESGKASALKPTYTASGDLKYEKTEITIPQGADRYITVINAYLKECKIAPAGAQAVSTELNGKTLTVKFNKEFDQTYGSDDERTLVQGILASIGQFPEVNFVQFTIEGTPMESMGHLDLSEPLPVESAG